jgi:hypothetical protein
MEKDGRHLDLHVQVNELLWSIANEIKNLHQKYDKIIEWLNNFTQNINNCVSQQEDIKQSIYESAKASAKYTDDAAKEYTNKPHFLVKYEWLVSTEKWIIFHLDPIEPPFNGKYRIEVSEIRLQKTNENVDKFSLPKVMVSDGATSPAISLSSKWGKAILEYDFDVLVTKL